MHLSLRTYAPNTYEIEIAHSPTLDIRHEINESHGQIPMIREKLTNQRTCPYESQINYNSCFNSSYKSTGPKCQYLVLSEDSFLYNFE